jgi:UPF0755 protein
MKNVVWAIVILLLIGVIGAGWFLLGPATGFSTEKEVLYIRTKAPTKQAVLDSIDKNNIVYNLTTFKWLASWMNYWTSIKPGKYEVKKGTSLFSLVRMLRNGRQTPVKLVITKLRTREDFARLAGNKFEFDSLKILRFLTNPDSLKSYELDSTTVMSAIIPDTYTYFWNATPSVVFEKLYDASQKFWTSERKQKAQAHGLTPVQAYTLASIIEEETNNNNEKGNIASVYLNRMNKGMPLQADPTVKFALKDFGLKRIYEKYLLVESPYNTYKNKGLPPGPICTPSRKSIDAVLNAPQTEYLYFVASPDFKQEHDFSTSYEEHLKKAKLYQQALNKRDSSNKAKAETK